jgi:hypothetical protein
MIKFFISILSIILSIGYGIAFYEYGVLDFHSDRLQYFIGGFVAFIPFWFMWLKNVTFYSTFEHEFTHLIVGLLFFKKPVHFEVTRHEGGLTGMYGGNFIITLAPYFLPTFGLLLMPLYLVISDEFQLYFLAIFGIIISYHIFSTIEEFSFQQPDIYSTGKVFSIIFLIFTNIFFYGYIIMFIEGGFSFGGDFLRQGIQNSYQIISHYVHFTINLINK